MARTREDWVEARRQLLDRWTKILERLRARDESGVLGLANEMDEFCDEAIAERELAAGAGIIPREAGYKLSNVLIAGSRCLFCRGFVETNGCLGFLQSFNHAVLTGEWPIAMRLAEEWIDRLGRLDLSRPGPAAA
jgi:hypothetical protein